MISQGDEAEILARVRGGESAAYGELVLRHAPVAKRTAVFLGAGADTDDVVQEAFVRALEHPPAWAGDDAPIRPWLVRVTMNVARDVLRRRKRRGYVGPWLPEPVMR